jgi:preprotein translocase subunit SecG
MLLGLLLTLNILVCLALIAVVLLQRSEGGALGGGGSPTGLVTTRGAGDLLTRTTWVLFSLFLILSLALTLIGGRERSSQAIINRLKLQSINPDSLVTRTPIGAANAAAPAPVAGAPKPTVRLPEPAQPAPAGGFATPEPVISLPPLPGPAKPAKP